MKKMLKLAACTAAALLLLGGCSTDISETVPKPTEAPATVAIPTKQTTASAAETSETTTEATTTTETTTETTEEISEESVEDPVDIAPEVDEQYSTFKFSKEYNDFLTHSVFVGDSICRGLKAYDVLPAKKVVAQGNVAARNIFDFTFKVGDDEMSILSALVNLKPKNVIFSMGMNDINITSEEKFCENYTNLLSLTESFLPDAKLYVCSITPLLYGSKFSTNENIDRFNAALKKCLDESEKWTYIDITREMKNSLNAMKTLYNGGDGIHLSKAAYYAMLYQVCERAVDNRIYDENGVPWIVEKNGELIRDEDTPIKPPPTMTSEAAENGDNGDGAEAELVSDTDEDTTSPPSEA